MIDKLLWTDDDGTERELAKRKDLTGQDLLDAEAGSYELFAALMSVAWGLHPSAVEELDWPDYGALLGATLEALDEDSIEWGGRRFPVGTAGNALLPGSEMLAGTEARVRLTDGRVLDCVLPTGAQRMKAMSEPQRSVYTLVHLCCPAVTESDLKAMPLSDALMLQTVAGVLVQAPPRRISVPSADSSPSGG